MAQILGCAWYIVFGGASGRSHGGLLPRILTSKMCLSYLVYGSNGESWSKSYTIAGKLGRHTVLKTFLISVPSIPSDNLPSLQETLPTSKERSSGRKNIMEQLPESQKRSSS